MSCRRITSLALVALSSAVLQPGSLLACAACYGQSDSPLAKGMNWGIFSLLAVVAVVLGSLASFFVYLGARSAAHPLEAQPESKPAATPEK